MARLRLTAENYYSQEANMEYMSASQYKSFRKCEAAALAELRGEWGRKETQALLVGSFIDAYFSGEMEQFTAEHPEIFNRDKSLKADFQKAMNAAKRLESDKLCRMLLSGRHQVIKTGKIGGVWYKCKADSLCDTKLVREICTEFPEVSVLVPFGGPIIVDLKYMKDFEPIWDEEAHDKLPFVEYWGYDLQGAIYQKLDKRQAPFVIVAATKEAEPNIDSFYIPDDALSFCMDEIEEYSPRYAAIKRGEIEPVGCGKCAYCRSMKRISYIKHYKLI